MGKIKSKHKQGLKYDFSLIALLLIPIGVAINFVGAQIVVLLKLPVFLDTIGTALAAMVGGPWIGALTGALTNALVGITAPAAFAVIPVQVAIGLMVGLISKYGMFTKTWKVILSIFIIVATALATSIPIQIFVFGGVTGSVTDVVTGGLVASGMPLWLAVFATKLVTETADKALCIIIALLIVKAMSPRYLSKLNYGEPFIEMSKKKVS